MINEQKDDKTLKNHLTFCELLKFSFLILNFSFQNNLQNFTKRQKNCHYFIKVLFIQHCSNGNTVNANSPTVILRQITNGKPLRKGNIQTFSPNVKAALTMSHYNKTTPKTQAASLAPVLLIVQEDIQERYEPTRTHFKYEQNITKKFCWELGRTIKSIVNENYESKTKPQFFFMQKQNCLSLSLSLYHVKVIISIPV